MGVLWGVAFHWLDVPVLVVAYIVCAFGTTIGFHRCFSHRSLQAEGCR
jgi:fatty-acid desaturase